ncbi:hypothetical protein IMSAGC013_04747 [Lachnospiraceae bacterium]|nr:hypothetical protein IMSAGC013_04747 [Lachnospiraceae bacterium]
MNPGPVGIKSSAVPLGVILKNLRLGNQIDHIKPKSFYALFFPKPDNILQFLPYPGILPVQICLCHIKQVQIPFLQSGNVFPGRTAEFGLPVGGRLPGRSFFKDIIIHIIFFPGQCLLKPFMPGGCMVKYHIHHDSHAPFSCLCNHLFCILHCAEGRMNLPVILYIIPIVIHGRGKKRCAPDIVNPKAFDIIQFLYDPPDIPNPISVAVTKRFGINLINHAFLKIFHNSLFLTTEASFPFYEITVFLPIQTLPLT